MNTDEIIKLNTKRCQIQLKPLLDQLRPNLSTIFKDFIIYDGDTPVKLNEIDFTHSCLFICPVDFSCLLGIYALQKINDVVYPDTTPQGYYSRIRTDFMIVDSGDIKYSKMIHDFEEDEVIPDMYKPTNYINKQVCIWRLQQDQGIGDVNTMYRLCTERLYERYLRNQLDWVFFLGTEKEYKETYHLEIPLHVYTLKSNKAIKENTTANAIW